MLTFTVGFKLRNFLYSTEDKIYWLYVVFLSAHYFKLSDKIENNFSHALVFLYIYFVFIFKIPVRNQNI